MSNLRAITDRYPVLAESANSAAQYARQYFQDIINNNGYAGHHGIPQMPLYFYKAVQDEIAPIGNVDALVSSYCAIGVDILYERNTIGGHLAEETNGDASAFNFLQQVLGGTYNYTGCITRDVAINVTDSAE